MSSKVEIKNGCIVEENGNFIAKYKDEETEQELKVNLTEQMRNFVNMDNVNFKVGKGRKGGGAGRKPTFKYGCSCGKIIKSGEEELAIRCLKCGKDFEKQE